MYVLAVAVRVVVSLRWSCRNSQYFYVASCSYVALHFDSKLDIIQGFITSGVGFGGLFFTMLNKRLLDELTYVWMLRINCFLFLLLVPLIWLFIVEMKDENDENTLKFTISNFYDWRFIMFLLQNFFIGFIYYLPYYYLEVGMEKHSFDSKKSVNDTFSLLQKDASFGSFFVFLLFFFHFFFVFFYGNLSLFSFHPFLLGGFP